MKIHTSETVGGYGYWNLVSDDGEWSISLSLTSGGNRYGVIPKIISGSPLTLQQKIVMDWNLNIGSIMMLDERMI